MQYEHKLVHICVYDRKSKRSIQANTNIYVYSIYNHILISNRERERRNIQSVFLWQMKIQRNELEILKMDILPIRKNEWII